MVTNSIALNAPVPSTSKDSGKKKRANRSAKLKQCKLDARREQWLSQGAVVKNKGCEEDQSARVLRKERKKMVENLETGREEEEHGNGLINQDFDLDSPSNSPSSSSSALCGTDSVTNFGASCTSSVSSSNGGCYSGNVTEDEGEEDRDGNGDGDDDPGFDDWEAMADALAASDDNKQKLSSDESSNLEEQCPPVHETMIQQVPSLADANLKQESPQRTLPRVVSGVSGRAWRADDEFRPQSLPNLAKQRSFPNTDRRHRHMGEIPWGRVASAVNVPSSCPICCEDLDYTDSSFLPCPCGYRLCLFCHNRILETDGRCPGCRKPYDKSPVETEASIGGESLTFKLARSYSMIARS